MCTRGRRRAFGTLCLVFVHCSVGHSWEEIGGQSEVPAHESAVFPANLEHLSNTLRSIHKTALSPRTNRATVPYHLSAESAPNAALSNTTPVDTFFRKPETPIGRGTANSDLSKHFNRNLKQNEMVVEIPVTPELSQPQLMSALLETLDKPYTFEKYEKLATTATQFTEQMLRIFGTNHSLIDSARNLYDQFGKLDSDNDRRTDLQRFLYEAEKNIPPRHSPSSSERHDRLNANELQRPH